MAETKKEETKAYEGPIVHRVLHLASTKPGPNAPAPLCVVDVEGPNGEDKTGAEKLARAQLKSLERFEDEGLEHPGFALYRQEIAHDAGQSEEPTMTLEH